MTREEFISKVEGTQRAFRRFLTALCCGDSLLADDIAQEAYIKVYMACDDLKDPVKFDRWLYRTGYNTFLNHKRSEKQHDRYEAAADLPSELTSDSRFQYQELYEALDRLPAKERTALLLFYMEDYSVKEIAATVDASEAAVKQYLSRGRAHLRGLLGTDSDL